LKKLIFRDDNFDAILSLNGNLPDISFFESINSTLIAADGAANNLLSINVIPDFIIGDLDSFDKNYRLNKTKIIQIDDQDTNDFEKCLIWCSKNNKQKILIIGFHGGELEHSINNISVFKKYSQYLELTILDRDRYGIFVNQSFTSNFNTNEIISIIPLPSALLRTKGLVWELDNTKLELGIKEGARNRTKIDFVEINVIYGQFLLFFDSRYPKIPLLI
jgi:thiamine pyrophosphokinase